MFFKKTGDRILLVAAYHSRSRPLQFIDRISHCISFVSRFKHRKVVDGITEHNNFVKPVFFLKL